MGDDQNGRLASWFEYKQSRPFGTFSPDRNALACGLPDLTLPDEGWIGHILTGMKRSTSVIPYCCLVHACNPDPERECTALWLVNMSLALNQESER